MNLEKNYSLKKRANKKWANKRLLTITWVRFLRYGARQTEFLVILNTNIKDTDSAAQCDICQLWVHMKCNNLNHIDYKYLPGSKDPWFYISCCNEIFPFGTLANKNFLYDDRTLWSHYRVRQTEFYISGHFSFYPLLAHKHKILKNWKNILEMPSFTHMYQKSWSYDICFLRCGVQQT